MGLNKTIGQYRKMGGKEFMKKWVEGIQGITPLQQIKISLMGVRLVIIGIVWGMVVTAIGMVWWLFAILFGSLIVTIMQWLGMKQKFYRFKQMEKLNV